MIHYSKSYVDGAWVDALSAKSFELVNPATEQPFATISLCGEADVDRAVQAAKRAFTSYSKTTPKQRIEYLRSIIAALTAREKDIIEASTRELGCPVSVNNQAAAAAAGFKQAIATLETYNFETRLGPNIVRREPIGVCGLITAWNWPVHIISTKVSSALAAGCTVVVKPSEFTPVSAIVFAEAIHAAGLPQGVFNLVIGDGPTVGQAICKHPDVDLVSFTGSTRAGVLVAEAAAPTVKRVAQELGGKSANIVLPDADLEAAAKWNVTRAFTNSGQSCHAPTRVLVHERQRDALLALLVREAGKVRLGDPQDPATTMGPVVNKAQFERVQRYIQIGLEEGAKAACGGLGRPAGLERGYFVKPTIFADVRPGMRIEQEEIFGPVLAVVTYKTEEEAIEIANGTEYGLGAYVFTRDKERGKGVGAQLRAGRVFLNGAPSNNMAPMGGYKHSGNGREMGQFGLEEYLEVKAMIGFDAAEAA
jgi:aldehyde dehydrogenase (NAD+)